MVSAESEAIQPGTPCSFPTENGSGLAFGELRIVWPGTRLPQLTQDAKPRRQALSRAGRQRNIRSQQLGAADPYQIENRGTVLAACAEDAPGEVRRTSSGGCASLRYGPLFPQRSAALRRA